ncbi:uncharacterized protein LOC103362231 [Stegastes partitus]|uniref:Uncharacterized protein LOC103362231 n=1 Tax=Stegastes partitus TaxID=144197 RepID=A0A9Y4N6G3_9TELE|nr:PREDICTED: uncharacterized protein LOC103362231 [Stegastes partitus]
MGQQSKDVESLQESGRRRGSCLDIFLVVSVLSLFVTLAALTAGGLMVVMELRSDLKTMRKIPEVAGPLKLEGGPPSPTNKTQNYAYLEPTSVKLRNSTMSWAHVNHGTWTSVGRNFEFDQRQHSLKPKQEGNYFMYVDLSIECVFQCKTGLLRVSIGDKFTCEVELPANSAPVSRKCWTVSWLGDEKLSAQMTVSEGGLENWKLVLPKSGFGVFLVD